MAAVDLQTSENSFLVKYLDMVNAKLHLVLGQFQHGNSAMPFLRHDILSVMKNKGLEMTRRVFFVRRKNGESFYRRNTGTAFWL